jgi:hypothetical protein
MLFLKELSFSLKEINKLTVPQVYLIIQRHNEPVYKQEIDNKVREEAAKDK